MKVFISWSGPTSHKVALELRDWVPSVIQALEPYVSSEDIDKGARWSTDIAEELAGSNFGILVVTRANLSAPWLNFEAGALSKAFDSARVSPFLFGIKRSEVKGPLLQFQSTIYDKAEVFKLMVSLNEASDLSVEPQRLNDVLEVWWPKLKEKLDAVSDTVAEGDGPESERDSAELLEEVLDLVRSQQRLLNSPEELLPPGYIEMVVSRTRSIAEELWPVVHDLEAWWRDVQHLIRAIPLDSKEPSEMRELMSAIDRVSMPIDVLVRELGRSPAPRHRFRN